MPYRTAWTLQKELVDRRVAGDIPDTLLLVEHEAVLTLGRQADPAHVRAYFPALVKVTQRLHGRWQRAARARMKRSTCRPT